MPEPMTSTAGSTSLAVIAVAMLGPMAGPYVLIVFSALAGSLWPLSLDETMTRSAGAWLVLRCTTLAVVLTSGISEYLMQSYKIDPGNSIALVSLLIGAMGNGWRPIFASLSSGVAALAARAARTTGGDK